MKIYKRHSMENSKAGEVLFCAVIICNRSIFVSVSTAKGAIMAETAPNEREGGVSFFGITILFKLTVK